MTRHATEQQVRDMYVENNYDINQFDDKITEIQTSQIFEKSQIREENSNTISNEETVKEYDINLCGVIFRIEFTLLHHRGQLAFSLFAYGSDKLAPVVQDRVMSLEEFKDTSP